MREENTLMFGPYWSEGLIALGISAFLVTVLLLKLIPVAQKIDLIDRPIGRKAHEKETPLIGGIAIFVSFTFAILLAPFGLGEYRLLFLSAGILVLVGILDDHRDIKPATKMVAQILAGLLLVYAGGTAVPSIGDIFAWHDGNEQGLGWLSSPLTVLAIIAVINAYNMIDGHDGLASGLFLVTSGTIIFLCTAVGQWKLQFLLAIIFVPTGVFFLFNCGMVGIARFKSFLGDAGSMLLGLMIAYGLIILSNEHEYTVRRVLAPWLLGLPMFDMAAVLVERAVVRRSVVRADRSHIHHLLMGRGISKNSVLGILLLFQSISCTIAILGFYLKVADWILFWAVFPALILYIVFRAWLRGGLTGRF